MPKAIVTGASSGIGMEMARILAEDGYDIVIVARRIERLQALKEELEENFKVKVFAYEKDLGIANAAVELYQQILEDGHDCEMLINNAGFGAMGTFESISWQDQEQMIQLNIQALSALSHSFISQRLQKNSQSYLLNVASVASFMPGPLMTVYYATKAYVLMFSEGLAAELRGKNIVVSALCPGPTKSEFQKRANMKFDNLLVDAFVPDSRTVAQYGIDSLKKSRVVAVQGWTNKIFIQLPRFLPRSLVRFAVHMFSKSIKVI